MNYTNLNIVSEDKTFKYIIEYFDDKSSDVDEIKYLKNEFGVFLFTDNIDNVLYEKNYYDKISENDVFNNLVLPKIYNQSSFDLYFPRFSVETYQRNISYVLTINTWVNGVCVFLASKLINRNNAIASEKGVKRFLNDEYYEYVRVNTIDPFELIYSDTWKKFRTEICGEKEIDGYQKNNTGSNINITLTPVKNINDTWVKLDGYDSSQSALQLTNKNDSNYLSAILHFKNENGNPEFTCNLTFNEVYNNNFTEYLEETYQITIDENLKMKYCFIIGDKENPYKYSEQTFDTINTQISFYLNDFSFESWDDYIDGLYANVVVIIQRFNEDILVISSNKVFITQEEFKYFLPQPIRNIDLQNINMEIKNYNVVNVIENKIVTVDRPNEYKSNIVKPIFIKVQESDTIRLHNSVTENICINLDAYKNKVDAFILKIGDMNFYEIGRINNGIIFKVVGVNLPQQNEGIYYILNEDGELVTDGKYVIV